MNKEKVLEVVNEVLVDKLTQLIEEMSSNEFVDMIKDKLVENGIEFDDEKQTVLIASIDKIADKAQHLIKQIEDNINK